MRMFILILVNDSEASYLLTTSYKLVLRLPWLSKKKHDNDTGSFYVPKEDEMIINKNIITSTYTMN